MKTFIEKQENGNRKSVLKEYYERYLQEIRGLSDSSVKHYFDALNNISRRLKDKGLVQQDIYEIEDLDRLNIVRELLYADPDFIILNERGKRMYSSGLNNYCRFAEGEGFGELKPKMMALDVPIEPETPVVVEQTIWKRSGILRAQAIEMANYTCELNSSHETFMSEKTHKPYMEGHHALPMNFQKDISVNLDVYANIVCLCPVCHRRIHYGLKDDRAMMIGKIYDSRVSRLANCGIEMSKKDFIDAAIEM